MILQFDDDEKTCNLVMAVKWLCTYMFTWSFSSRFMPQSKCRELSARISGLKRELKNKFGVSDIDVDFPSRTCTFSFDGLDCTIDW